MAANSIFRKQKWIFKTGNRQHFLPARLSWRFYIVGPEMVVDGRFGANLNQFGSGEMLRGVIRLNAIQTLGQKRCQRLGKNQKSCRCDNIDKKPDDKHR
jgi:hypothetical protein